MNLDHERGATGLQVGRVMRRIKLGRIIVCLIVIVLSFINYESDLAKFLFSGYSSTYDVVMIRHSPYLIISLAALTIFLSVAEKFIFWLKYSIPLAAVFWVLSMRTEAYVYTDGTLVSGWSFIRITSSTCATENESVGKSEVEPCDIDFDPILDRKLKVKLRLRYPQIIPHTFRTSGLSSL